MKLEEESVTKLLELDNQCVKSFEFPQFSITHAQFWNPTENFPPNRNYIGSVLKRLATSGNSKYLGYVCFENFKKILKT